MERNKQMHQQKQYDMAVRYKDADKRQRVAAIHGNPFTIKSILEKHGAKMLGFRFIGGIK